MLQLVYDNDLTPTIAGELHWPARWTAEDAPADSKWKDGQDAKSFETQGGGSAESWIAYQHRVPARDENHDAWLEVAQAGEKGISRIDSVKKLSRQQWCSLLRDNPPLAKNAPPRLISDFAGYNTSLPSGDNGIGNGMQWVGDLAVKFDVRIALGCR